MKSIGAYLLSFMLLLLTAIGCQSVEKEEKVSQALEMLVDTLSYVGRLDSMAQSGTVSQEEAELGKSFVKLFANKLDPEWSYADVLRRAQGRAAMMANGLKGIIDEVKEVDSEKKGTARFVLSVRCQNMLEASIDVFSISFGILDGQGDRIYTTNFLTNVQALAVQAWSAPMPFGIEVLHTDSARLKALRTLEKGHSEANFDFRMAYVKFTDGPTLNDYWLDSAR